MGKPKKPVISPEKRKLLKRYWTLMALTSIPLACSIMGIIITYPVMHPTNVEAVTALMQLSGVPLIAAIALMIPTLITLERYNSIGTD